MTVESSSDYDESDSSDVQNKTISLFNPRMYMSPPHDHGPSETPHNMPHWHYYNLQKCQRQSVPDEHKRNPPGTKADTCHSEFVRVFPPHLSPSVRRPRDEKRGGESMRAMYTGASGGNCRGDVCRGGGGSEVSECGGECAPSDAVVHASNAARAESPPAWWRGLE